MNIEEISYIHSHSQESGHSPVYRSHICKETGELELIPSNGTYTLYEGLQHAIKKFGDKQAIGSRRIVDTIEEVKIVEKKIDGEVVKEEKKWKYVQLSPYEWITYNQLSEDIDAIGSAMVHLGLGGEKRLAIFAPTSRYWSTMSNGCYTQNISIVTVYDTLGADGLKHGLNEGEVPAIFIAPEQLGTVLKAVKDVPSLKHIFYTGDLNESQKKSISDIREDIEMLSFDELLELGKKNSIEHHPPTPEDIALIMYTSGTTGNPKGVMITHTNIVAVFGGVEHLVGPLITPEEDRYISFLPLAHILAFSVDAFLLHYGLEIAYSSPRTLTDASVRNCQGDIKEAKPTIMVGVPQIYDTIRKGVLNKINKAGTVASTVFNTSLMVKSGLSSFGLPTFLLDNLVFNKVKEQLGGRLRYAVSGGAPISDDVREFFSTAVCHLLQGYGLTEICGLACANTPELPSRFGVGQISPCNEFKLVDVPEAGYLYSNERPQGEIWFRGGSVTKGYYKNEEATKKEFTEDGWFRTGDICELAENGTLSVIDRLKNLVKLANGEYIALERLENNYRNVLYVHNICICADSQKPKAVALVQPNMDAIRQFASANGLPDIYNLEDVAKSSEIRKEVYNALIAEGKRSGFVAAELIADVRLVSTEWTSDNGLLTTSQKLKRKPIAEQFKEELDEMYSKI